jgi:hypothetical protein
MQHNSLEFVAPRNSVETLKSGLSKKTKLNSDLVKPIDTVKLARTEKRILRAKQITLFLLAREVVGIAETSLSSMLSKPTSWVKYTDYTKSLWQKMLAWSQSTEAIRSLKSLQGSNKTGKLVEAFKCQLSKKRGLESDDAAEEAELTIQRNSCLDSKTLDTAMLAKTIRDILKDHRITLALFAKEVVGANDCNLTTMLNKPIPWADKTEFKQTLWRKIHKWSQSSEAIQFLAAAQAKKVTNNTARSKVNF